MGRFGRSVAAVHQAAVGFFRDAGSPDLRTGFDMAGARYRCEGGMVIRLRPSRPTVEALTSAPAAAFLSI